MGIEECLLDLLLDHKGACMQKGMYPCISDPYLLLKATLHIQARIDLRKSKQVSFKCQRSALYESQNGNSVAY